MTYLWDTDTCIYFLNGNTIVAQRAVTCGLSEICITAVTVAELLFGAYNSRHVAANVTQIGKLQNAITVLDTITTTVADHFGRNKALLRRSGHPIGDLDLLIAGFALAHDLTLVTNNVEHFRRIPGLKLENWIVA